MSLPELSPSPVFSCLSHRDYQAPSHPQGLSSQPHHVCCVPLTLRLISRSNGSAVGLHLAVTSTSKADCVFPLVHQTRGTPIDRVRSDDTTATVSPRPTGPAISKPRDLPRRARPHALHYFFPFPATTGVGTAPRVGTASSTVFAHPCTRRCQCDLPDAPSPSHSPPGHRPALHFHQALSLAQSISSGVTNCWAPGPPQTQSLPQSHLCLLPSPQRAPRCPPLCPAGLD